MRKIRTFGVAAVFAAAAVVPLAAGSFAGAQDAGDCGSGGVGASSTQTNAGGLLGAVAPIAAQIVLPVTLPVASPNAQSCNSNSNSIGGGGGGGGVAGGSAPASAVGGAPRFAG